MTLEEFFIKKRIDLPALEKAEPGLFSEFKTHFMQMGEKSFDHTKKYWFNKLRRQFHLAPEVKPEKVAIANPLAQQTITESLTETATPVQPAKQGFVPRFKAANVAKPPVAEDKTEEQATASAPAAAPAKPGFTPRFKAANMAKSTITEDKTAEKPTEAESTPQPQPAKPGFTPRFNAANMAKPAVIEDKIEEKRADTGSVAEEKSTEVVAPKATYKPRFNMKNIPPKKEE